MYNSHAEYQQKPLWKHSLPQIKMSHHKKMVRDEVRVRFLGLALYNLFWDSGFFLDMCFFSKWLFCGLVFYRVFSRSVFWIGFNSSKINALTPGTHPIHYICFTDEDFSSWSHNYFSCMPMSCHWQPADYPPIISPSTWWHSVADCSMLILLRKTVT